MKTTEQMNQKLQFLDHVSELDLQVWNSCRSQALHGHNNNKILLSFKMSADPQLW